MAALEKYLPRCRIFLLDGEKFRTNLFVLFFDLPLKRETATKTALLAEVLKKMGGQEAAKQAEELYGALWDVSVVKKGNRQLLLFSLETLKTVHTEDALSFLQERVLGPMTEGTFDEKTVKRQKRILQRKLEGLQDNKRAFAQKRVSEETAEGTAYAISGDGYIEDLAEISEKSLFLYYRNILEKAEVKIFFCGDQAEKPRILLLRQEFPGRVAAAEVSAQEQTKNGPRFLQESAEMEQARLLMGFSADAENSHRQAALRLLNHLLGGSPDSLLFQKIREERGLCYDVKSYLEPMSPYLFVQAGIRAEDAKETGKLVLKSIEQLKKEGVPDEKLEQAKENILRDYDGMADSPWAMVDYFAEQVLQGNPLTTEKFLRQIERTDTEDIIRAVNHLELKVVYLLRGKEEEHGAE
ncbi:MAG: insulinase family protein [Anaerotignum sp.]|nr:insulinase family protein [Anaerotignum sp.]